MSPWQCSPPFLSEAHSHFSLSLQILYVNTSPFTIGDWLDLSLSWESRCLERGSRSAFQNYLHPHRLCLFPFALMEKSGIGPFTPAGSQFPLLVFSHYSLYLTNTIHSFLPLGRIHWSSSAPRLLISWSHLSFPIFKVPNPYLTWLQNLGHEASGARAGVCRVFPAIHFNFVPGWPCTKFLPGVP